MSFVSRRQTNARSYATDPGLFSHTSPGDPSAPFGPSELALGMDLRELEAEFERKQSDPMYTTSVGPQDNAALLSVWRDTTAADIICDIAHVGLRSQLSDGVRRARRRGAGGARDEELATASHTVWCGRRQD